MVDRYEIGERQTSACAAPTEWLERLGLRRLDPPELRRSASCTPRRAAPAGALPFTLLDLRLPRAVRAAARAGLRATTFETATVEGIDTGPRAPVHTDRGELRAPLVVDALGWRRVLSNGRADPAAAGAPLARARGAPRGHRRGSRDLDRPAATCAPATAGASPPAASCASASARSSRATMSRTATVAPRRDSRGLDAVRFQGNWIPHQLRAGHRGRRLLRRRLGRALPAADRRGHPPGVLLRARPRSRAAPRARRAARPASRRSSATARSAPSTPGSTRGLLAAQHLVGRATGSAAVRGAIRLVAWRRVSHWVFGHYLAIAPPEFVGASSAAAGLPAAVGCRAARSAPPRA